MLAAQVHIGTQNSDYMMAEYIWRRRQDGIHIINIGKTWEKLMLGECAHAFTPTHNTHTPTHAHRRIPHTPYN